MSPGWQSSALQMASSVSKPMQRTLPDFSSEIFYSVMSTSWAKVFERILRFASMTSTLTKQELAELEICK